MLLTYWNINLTIFLRKLYEKKKKERKNKYENNYDI